MGAAAFLPLVGRHHRRWRDLHAEPRRTARPSGTASACDAGAVPELNAPDVIRRLLTEPGRWAVVGLSTSTARAAYSVSAYLQDLGHRIVPVHPHAETVHGAPGYASVLDVPGAVDVVDVFVNSAHAGAVVDHAIEVGAGAVWLQLGVIDEAAAGRALAAGLDVVMDRCPAIEGRRLGLPRD